MEVRKATALNQGGTVMSEKGGAAAAVSALTAKAKLAGMWREKVDQHNTGSPVYERIERVIVERAPQPAPGNIPDESIHDEPTSSWITAFRYITGFRFALTLSSGDAPRS